MLYIKDYGQKRYGFSVDNYVKYVNLLYNLLRRLT